MRFQHARVHLKCYQAQQDTKSQVCFKKAYRQILHFLFSRAPGKDVLDFLGKIQHSSRGC